MQGYVQIVEIFDIFVESNVTIWTQADALPCVEGFLYDSAIILTVGMI